MMMKSQWKKQPQGAENNRGISGQMLTLHHRLCYALNLGRRSHGDKGRKWDCADIEIQKHVVHSIDAFLDCISAETLHHPLVKDSIADVVAALEGVLQFKNEAALSLASNVAVKMINILPSSILQSHVLDLVQPLSSLLPSHQLQVAVSCATALQLILANLSSRMEGEVWVILKETNTVVHIVSNIKDFSGGTKPIEYFQEMVSLLSKILWRWPSSRFCAWTDAKLMEVLQSFSLNPDFSIQLAVLQLYSALALCGNGAQKLLEKGETVRYMLERSMAKSNPILVQMEGFKLAQYLTINEEGCTKVMKTCCEHIVEAIINGMGSWSSHSGKIPKDQMSLLIEACRLALITRWAGRHHAYFWKLRVDKVLLNLLLDNFHKTHQSEHLSLEEQIATAQQGLSAKFLHVLRPFVWDILGGLAAHCPEDFDPKTHGSEQCIKLLIICAGLAFLDSIHNARQLCQTDISDLFWNESAIRSVLMMIYSPSKYIASQARLLLSEILRSNGKEYLKHVLDKLNSFIKKFGMLDIFQTIINLMSLACYSGLPQYRKHVIKGQGIKTLLAFIRWCLSNYVHIKRSSMVPQLNNTFSERTCCWVQTDWDGEDIPLLYILWALAELIHHSGSMKTHPDIFSGQADYNEAQLVNELKGICSDISSPGPRWYAVYILSYFGFYGFPNKLGKRIGKTLNEKELSDLELILMNGEHVSVHGAILMARCPSLLPPKELHLNEKSSDASSGGKDEKCERSRKEVRLSAHVDHQALLKLLEYVYLGYLQAGVDHVKKLKSFAKHCNLQCLLQMLQKKSPKWGTPFPSLDLTFALEQAGHNFSDIIMEAKGTNQTYWRCCTCSVSIPHMHVHKVILCSSCDYFRALFQSGMQESQSETIKVPVSWEALEKLVRWFYSDELPKPISGCLWDNLDNEEKLQELCPFVELSQLAEFWLLGDVHEHCTRVIISCLNSDRHLSVKIMQISANLNQWKLVEVAANYMAPLYHRLKNSGELEVLDEDLVDMVRAASVRLSQVGGHHPHV